MHKHQRTLASMKRLLLFFTLITLFAPLIDAQWQWRVSVSDWISGETGTSPDAFLWIPENCQKVNAVMFANQNMDEETLLSFLLSESISQKWGLPLSGLLRCLNSNGM